MTRIQEQAKHMSISELLNMRDYFKNYALFMSEENLDFTIDIKVIDTELNNRRRARRAAKKLVK